jgi:hypothetical protein
MFTLSASKVALPWLRSNVRPPARELLARKYRAEKVVRTTTSNF